MKTETSFSEFEELKEYFEKHLSYLHVPSEDPPSVVSPPVTSLQSASDVKALRTRLRMKIEGIREHTGTLKRKARPDRARKAKKEAQRQRRKRRTVSKHIQKSKTAPSPHTPSQPSVVFTELEEKPEQRKESGKKGKSLRQKFQKLKTAQKLKQESHDFAQTGQNGARVLQSGWDHAMQRASGKRVLDDPGRIQKSIDDTFKLKERRARKWQKRLDEEDTLRLQRQEKRKRNLDLRSQQRSMKKKARKSNRS